MLYPIVQNGKYGFIDAAGNIVIPARFESAMAFSEGLAGIEEGGNWGFIDLAGNMVIRPQFDSCKPFSSGLAVVESGEEKHYINAAGERVITTDYYLADSFHGDLALVQRDMMCQGVFIDRQGNVVLSDRSYALSKYSDGLINCPDGEIGGGKWGFATSDGDFAIAPTFTSAYPFSEGLAAVAQEKKESFCFINTSGELEIDREFGGADIGFVDGLCAVWQSAFGYIDRTGDLVIDYRFYFAGHFADGLAVIREHKGGLYGYANAEGSIVIEPQFKSANAFRDNLAQVVVGEKFDTRRYGYIDREGNYVWTPTR